MTAAEREDKIVNIFEQELLPTLAAKGHDYAGNEDCMSNLVDFGWQGVVVRMGDKYHRIKNFAQHTKLLVRDESIEDTLKDLINYAFLCLLLYRQEQAEPEITTAEEAEADDDAIDEFLVGFGNTEFLRRRQDGI